MRSRLEDANEAAALCAGVIAQRKLQSVPVAADRPRTEGEAAHLVAR
jgi:hypothetical protein